MPTPRLTQMAELAASGDKDALDDFVLEAPSSYLEQFDTPEGAAEAYLNKARKDARGSQPQEGADPTPGTPAQPMSSMPGLASVRNAIKDYASSPENSPFTGLENLSYVDEGQDLQQSRDLLQGYMERSKEGRFPEVEDRHDQRVHHNQRAYQMAGSSLPYDLQFPSDRRLIKETGQATHLAQLYLRNKRYDDAEDVLTDLLQTRGAHASKRHASAASDDHIRAMLRTISAIKEAQGRRDQEDLANRQPDLGGE